jgi:hypothetical protein
MIVTRQPKPPTSVKIATGRKWVCVSYQPITGRPVDQAGRYLLSWTWVDIDQAAPPPPAPSASFRSSPDLFG